MRSFARIFLLLSIQLLIPQIPGTASLFAQDPKTDHPEFDALLYQAIIDRLGAPYLEGGTDISGYDCSGLVWRVFKEAGVEIKRTSTRTLWKTLPKASKDERGEFGILVFFKDLNHVGIVRDDYSFYHASTSQGVTRSFYSEYWGERIIGYRKVPIGKAAKKVK